MVRSISERIDAMLRVIPPDADEHLIQRLESRLTGTVDDVVVTIEDLAYVIDQHAATASWHEEVKRLLTE